MTGYTLHRTVTTGLLTNNWEEDQSREQRKDGGGERGGGSTELRWAQIEWVALDLRTHFNTLSGATKWRGARPVKGDYENIKTASDPRGLVRKEATDHDCETKVVSKGERKTLMKKRKLEMND